jgi:hypothetical protein
LRSGKESGSGDSFDSTCTQAYSRILDTTEIFITMNLDTNPRSDFVTLDVNLSPAGQKMPNLLDSDHEVIVEE